MRSSRDRSCGSLKDPRSPNSLHAYYRCTILTESESTSAHEPSSYFSLCRFVCSWVFEHSVFGLSSTSDRGESCFWNPGIPLFSNFAISSAVFFFVFSWTSHNSLARGESAENYKWQKHMVGASTSTDKNASVIHQHGIFEISKQFGTVGIAAFRKAIKQ